MNWNSSRNAAAVALLGASAASPRALRTRLRAAAAHRWRELLHPGADARVVGDQLGAPALGLVQGRRILGAAELRLEHRHGGSARSSTPRISLPMYCIWRRLPSCERVRRYSCTASRRPSGMSSACTRDSGSATSASRDPQFVRGLLALRLAGALVGEAGVVVRWGRSGRDIGDRAPRRRERLA